MKHLKPFCLLFVFTLPACQATTEKQEIKESEKLEYPFNYVEKVGEQMKYSLRSSSSKHHEIRLWLNYEVLTSSELITIKDVDSRTYLTKYHLIQSDETDLFYVDSVIVKIERPITSTRELTNRLYELGFKELMEQPDSIKSRIGDGTTLILELRDSIYYKAISYNLPHLFQDENHQIFMSIVKELEQSMNWKYRSGNVFN